MRGNEKGVKYTIWLRGRGGNAVLFKGETPETIRPELIEHTKSDFVEKRLKLCKDCQGDHPHVIEEVTGRKFCPILFSDAVKPGWTARHLLTGFDDGEAFEHCKGTKEAGMEQVIALKVSEVRAGANYRKSGDKAKMSELTESVKARGVLTPIWVRKNGSGHLIIAGHRRHQAAIAAGLETIPAIVKEATDEQAMELSVIENDQREDVNPMEQAMGYKDLLDKGKHTPETLALKLGKNVPYVLGRLKLLNIPKEAQKALLEGKIEYGHALLLTRLKNNGDQKTLLEDILEEGLSVTAARQVMNQFSTRLGSAAFDVKTACSACPSRSKNQTALFPEAAKEKDDCLDASCFFTKTREHYQKLAKDMAAKGVKVLTSAQQVQSAKNGKNAREISPDAEGHSYSHPKKYTTMCMTCDKRTFYCYEEARYGGRKAFEIGEICLDEKCFNKMNGHKDVSMGSSSRTSDGRPRSNASRIHAVAMRDRFLRTRMPVKVEANDTLQRRLLLFHFLCQFDRFTTMGKPEIKKDQDQTLAEILREHCPTWKQESILDEQKLFAAIGMIPAVSIAAVTRKAVLACVPFTDADVLLQGMGESGLSFEKDFVIDNAFLQTKTKGELVDLAVKKFGLPATCATTDMKKPEIIKGILGHKLLGKVPPEVAKECRVITLGGVKAKAKKKGK